MSIESMAMVLHHSKATGTAKLILLGIANHDGDGGAWPTLATLGKYANTDERTVRRVLRKLEEAGEITTERNQGGTANQRDDRRPNVYRINVECPRECDRTTQHRVPDNGGTPSVTGGHSVHDGGTKLAERGDISGLTGGSGCPPNHKEPSKEPNNNHPEDAERPPADPPRADVELLCTTLANNIHALGVKKPTITTKWRTAARLLLDRDGYTVEQVLWIMGKLAEDEFWSRNVLSMPKFRDKADQLKLTYRNQTPKKRGPAYVDDLQQPPDGLTATEYAAWEHQQRARRAEGPRQ